MNEKFSEWYEIAHVNADHDRLQRRWQAVEKVVDGLRPAQVFEFSRTYYGLPSDGKGNPSELIEAVREFDNAFVENGRQLEISLLAGTVLAEAFKSKAEGVADLAALATVVPSLQGNRSAPSITTLVEIAEKYLATRSAELRKSVQEERVEHAVSKATIEAVVQPLKDSQFPQAAEQLAKLVGAQNEILKGQTAEIRSLERQYALLREESDILWWLTGGHSRIAKCMFGDLAIGAAALLVGRELADLTSVVPGPIAILALASQMLKKSFDGSSKTEISLGTAINAIDKEVRVAWANDAKASVAAELCPLISGVGYSTSVAKSTEWQPLFKKAIGIEAKVKLEPALLSRQLYLESILMRAGNST